MFQVGDSVVVKHTQDEGVVVEIINDKMVMLEVKGVKFPSYNDQLEFPYFKRFMEQKKVPLRKEKTYVDDIRKETKPLENKIIDGVWLTFIPLWDTDEFGDDLVETLKIHLVNRTPAAYNFNYQLSYIGKDGFSLKNMVQPFEDFYLHNIPFENMNDSPLFECEFELTPAQKSKALHFETQLKLKPKQVFQKVQELKQRQEATFSYRLFEHYPDKEVEPVFDTSPLVKAGFKVYDAKHARQHLETPKYEVDLHIDALTHNYEKMTVIEKLGLQLSTFEKYLDLAVAHHQQSLIMIHGVGTGKLRDEIHAILRTRSEVKSFINRYHPAYGYGATEIYLK